MDIHRDDSIDFTESTTATREVPDDPLERGACETPRADADLSEFEPLPGDIERDEGRNTRRADDEKMAVSELDGRQLKDENELRYERNLKKFMANGKAFLEVRSRRGRTASERLIKSDGFLAEKVDYSRNVMKISSILSKVKLERSSAPPTYDRENNLETSNVEGADGGQSATGGFLPSNSERPASFGTREIRNATDFKLPITPVTDFKLPVTPTTSPTTTPCESSNLIHSSPGLSKIQAGQSTPVMRRPTVFNFQPRKAFYMFSPEGSGILRQCQSLPNINKQQRKEEKHYQRRSLILDERSRIVRSLFKDEPGQATPETKLSMVPQSHIPRPSVAKDASDRAPPANIRSKICRKLDFTRPQEITKIHQTGNAEATIKGENPEAASPGKRKEISTPTDGCPPESSKKVRILPEPQTKDSSNQTASMCEEESNASGKSFDTLRGRKDESSTSEEK